MERLFRPGESARWGCWAKRMARYAAACVVPALAVADRWPVPPELSPLGFRCVLCTALWLLFLVGAGYLDYRAGRGRLSRKVLRGTREITPGEFNQQVRGNGVGFPYLFSGPQGSVLGLMRIPREEEPGHVLIGGDTGKGKSALMHHLLCQIAGRPEESVILYDPALEFWRSHGRPCLGDVLLHPLYVGCPYWSPSLEVENSLDPEALAMSFLPNKVEGREDFWDQAPRAVLTFLFEQLAEEGGSVSDFLQWLSDPGLIWAFAVFPVFRPQDLRSFSASPSFAGVRSYQPNWC